eukprot:2234769-Pyramimonas_sp.AAC.1
MISGEQRSPSPLGQRRATTLSTRGTSCCWTTTASTRWRGCSRRRRPSACCPSSSAGSRCL